MLKIFLRPIHANSLIINKFKYSFNINFMQHNLTIVKFMRIIIKLKLFLIIHS